jgi:UDP-glucose 4-epimerase
VVDNLVNSSAVAIERVRELAGRDFPFHQVDLLDRAGLRAVFEQHAIDAVIHFAGLKSVGESVAQPLRYYHNNVTGTLVLCELMAEHGVKQIVFSSSATVYGAADTMPLTEDTPLGPANPYGHSKHMIEQLLRDLHVADAGWGIAILRYFNPVGAHASGRIGEDPNGIPNNLVPFIAQVAVGKLPQLRVYGNHYPTPDGTGVRDFVHVVDLAVGHVNALQRLAGGPGFAIYNLGSGRGHSVLEVIAAFERAAGRPIPYTFAPPRPGDSPVSYADPARATRELGWSAERDLDVMCADTWRWQQANPNGYQPDRA